MRSRPDSCGVYFRRNEKSGGVRSEVNKEVTDTVDNEKQSKVRHYGGVDVR